MNNHKHTILKKIGLNLFITGSSLTIIAIMVKSFKTDIILGIIMLGIFITSLGAILLLRE